MQTILKTGIFTMKRLLLTTILLMLFAANSNASNATQAILKLDTKGHTGLIGDIIVTKNSELISASDDKTIRVWDIKSGKEKRKILGEIGAGSEGKVFAIALSSDEQYLAVGGYWNDDIIRIYKYKWYIKLSHQIF